MQNEEKSRDGTVPDKGSLQDISRLMPSIEHASQRWSYESQVSKSFSKRPREHSVHNFSRPLTTHNAAHDRRRHSFPATRSRSNGSHDDQTTARKRQGHHDCLESIFPQHEGSRSQHSESMGPSKQVRRSCWEELDPLGENKATIGETDRLDFALGPDKSQRRRSIPPRPLRFSCLESIAPDELSPDAVPASSIPTTPTSALYSRSPPRERPTWNCLPCTPRRQLQPTSTGATNSGRDLETRPAASQSPRYASTAGTEKSLSSVSDSKGGPSTVSKSTEGVSFPANEDFAKYSSAHW